MTKHVVRIEREHGVAKRMFLDGVPVRGLVAYTLSETVNRPSVLVLDLIIERVEMIDVATDE